MGFFDSIMGSISSRLRSVVQGARDEFLTTIFMGIKRVEQHFIREITSALIFIIGGLFLVLSGMYFLIEYMMLTKTIAFLIGGIFLILIGIIVKFMR